MDRGGAAFLRAVPSDRRDSRTAPLAAQAAARRASCRTPRKLPHYTVAAPPSRRRASAIAARGSREEHRHSGGILIPPWPFTHRSFEQRSARDIAQQVCHQHRPDDRGQTYQRPR